jgi:hypothetical protein
MLTRRAGGKSNLLPGLWRGTDAYGQSSNRSWAYGGEIFYAPSASKICLPRISTTTCKGNDHGLTYKTNIYTKI